MADREIESILCSRKDISPFLVHLTKDTDKTVTARATLETILKSQVLEKGPFPGNALKSLIYGTDQYPGYQRLSYSNKATAAHKHLVDKILEDCSCVCMTETPLDQIHCMFDIASRQVKLKPYGLVLLKEKIRVLEDVNPVIYLNTYSNITFAKSVLETIWRLSFETMPQDVASDSHIKNRFSFSALWKLLAFMQPMGKSFTKNPTIIDFSWEREWRSLKDINLNWKGFWPKNVFLGLCPDDEIQHFEAISNGLPFIDPYRSPSFYAEKILERKAALKLNHNLM